jgi:diguanylate cyclase (GGDEF)-like protein
LPGVASLAAGAFATAQLFDQIRHLATHDPLTGLPNLRAFTDETAADPSESPCPTAGVIFVDLDRFKQVNDRFGHAIGDQLLVAVGQRLRAAVRRADRVIRIGGDEFAIQLCHLCTFEDAQTIATRLLRTVASPFELAGHTIHISASVGVALVAHQDESLDTLLSRSDAAMYAAKSAGGATSRFAEVA